MRESWLSGGWRHIRILASTWLSDFVPQPTGRFPGEEQPRKPQCPLIGEDGNIFHLVGVACRTLRENDLKEQAKELQSRVFSSGSYPEALGIIGGSMWRSQTRKGWGRP